MHNIKNIIKTEVSVNFSNDNSQIWRLVVEIFFDVSDSQTNVETKISV